MFVVFKRRRFPKNAPLAGIHVGAQKGWMLAGLMADWLKAVWGRDGGLLVPLLLVAGSFRGHLEEGVWCHMQEMRTDIAVIPGGLTSVLDDSISKWRLYTEWMAERSHHLTPAGKIRRPSIDKLCRWILEA